MFLTIVGTTFLFFCVMMWLYACLKSEAYWKVVQKNGYYVVMLRKKYFPFWSLLSDVEIIRSKYGEYMGVHVYELMFEDEHSASFFMDYYKTNHCFPPQYENNKKLIRWEEVKEKASRELIPVDKEPKYGGKNSKGEDIWSVDGSTVTELVLKSFMCYRLEKDGRWTKPRPWKIDVSNMGKSDSENIFTEAAKRLSRKIDYNSNTGEINGTEDSPKHD